jgi:putative membrane protein
MTEVSPIPPPTPRKKPLEGFTKVISTDFGLFKGRPLMYGAVLLASLIPAAYCVIYLSSVWDPYGNLKNLPAGIVNLDQPSTYQNKAVHIGQDILQELQRDQPFKLKSYPSLEAARKAVSRNEVYFAVILPQDLSQKSVQGDAKERAALEVVVSEGTSFTASTIGRRFADGLALNINQKLNEKRFLGVLEGQTKLETGFDKLRKGAAELLGGAEKLSSGANTLANGSRDLSTGLETANSGGVKLSKGATDLSSGVSKLTDGVDQLHGGVKTLQSKLPAKTDLDTLEGGAKNLSSGQTQLSAGLGKLAAGSQTLASKTAELSAGLGKLDVGAKSLETGSGDLSSGLNSLKSGATQLEGGATDLNGGLVKLEGGATQLKTGLGDLSSGLDQLSSASSALPEGNPIRAGLGQSAAGSKKLLEGATGLQAGLGNAKAGSAKLSSGANQLEGGLTKAGQGAEKVSSGAKQLEGGLTQASEGAKKLSSGAATLASSAKQAEQGAEKLEQGGSKLQNGVTALTAGMIKIKEGVATLEGKFPEKTVLDQLSSGANTLASKSQELSSGLAKLADGGAKLKNGSSDLSSGAKKVADGAKKLLEAIPSDLSGLSGDAQGLAVSVETRAIVENSVPNNGTAYAPYFIALSLWVGATITTFIFHYLLFPSRLREVGQGSKIAGKAVLPFITLVLQALWIAVALIFVLHIPVPDWGSFSVVVFAGIFTYLSVFLVLLTLFGDAGRLVAILLMVFQLGAAGGSFPVELLPQSFQDASNYLPITDCVKGLRAVLFGSYGGDWLTYVLRMALTSSLSLVLAWLLGRRRWRYTPDELYAPAVHV